MTQSTVPAPRDQTFIGTASGFGAYLMWGLTPIFWKLLGGVPALELIGHRIAWAAPSLCLVIALTGSWHGLRPAFRSWRNVGALVLSTFLILGNWLTFVYAVITDRILETSLGYFINPLVFTLLGFLFLGERLRRRQTLAVAIAAVGVGYLTLQSDQLPWIALVLAFSFGFYGLMRKVLPVNGLHGLTLETILLFPLSVGYLIYLHGQSGAFGQQGLTFDLLLICAGPVTAIPLLLFSFAVRRVTLATMGFLQYLAPTMTFILGIFVYGEPFSRARLVAFSCIWIALIIYSADGILHNRRRRKSPLPAHMPADLPD